MSALDVSLPSGASYPPKPGEHAYYHSKSALGSYLMPGTGKLATYSTPERRPAVPWISYTGLVPVEFDRASSTIEAEALVFQTSAARME